MRRQGWAEGAVGIGTGVGSGRVRGWSGRRRRWTWVHGAGCGGRVAKMWIRTQVQTSVSSVLVQLPDRPSYPGAWTEWGQTTGWSFSENDGSSSTTFESRSVSVGVVFVHCAEADVLGDIEAALRRVPTRRAGALVPVLVQLAGDGPQDTPHGGAAQETARGQVSAVCACVGGCVPVSAVQCVCVFVCV